MLATSIDYLGSADPLRDELRAQDDVQFVDRDEFCELLVSRLSLSRCDVPGRVFAACLTPRQVSGILSKKNCCSSSGH